MWNRCESGVRSKGGRSETEVSSKWDRSEMEVKPTWERSEINVRSEWKRIETKVKSKWNGLETEVRSKWDQRWFEMTKWKRRPIEHKSVWNRSEPDVKPKSNRCAMWDRCETKWAPPPASPQTSRSAFRLVLRYFNFNNHNLYTLVNRDREPCTELLKMTAFLIVVKMSRQIPIVPHTRCLQVLWTSV